MATAHELVHAAGFWLAGAERVELDIDAEAAHVDAWPGDNVRLGLWRLACILPTVVGVFIASLVGTAALVNGWTLPDNVVGWARLAIALVAWGVFTAPSPADVQEALR
jgi:hypothetical protein